MKSLNSRSRCGFLALLIASFVSPAVIHAVETVDLRGYGKVAADLTPARTVFACQSVEKADILLDKLLADWFWDKTLPVQTKAVQLDAAQVSSFSLPGYGAVIIARTGSRVIVLGGADERDVSSRAIQEPLLKGTDVTSQAAKPHPIYLDYFDHKAYSAYASSFLKSKDSAGRRFMKLLGAGNNYQGPQYQFECPAPGVMNWPQCDAEIQDAERQQNSLVLGMSGGGSVPLWVANAFPDNMMQPTGTTVMGDWGGSFATG
ncbi:MAG: hypothetical protein WCI73_19840, partial [Phycisphaerae bacterium]